jgi:hypothetical protein
MILINKRIHYLQRNNLTKNTKKVSFIVKDQRGGGPKVFYPAILREGSDNSGKIFSNPRRV